MTREEAIRFLIDTKVYVKDKSREIQAKLFSLGFRWNLEYQKIHHIDKPFLFMYRDGAESFITYSTDVEWFNHHPSKEITPEDILNITTEPKYRPFKDKVECWNEMKKHHPFGWIRDNYLDYYRNITIVNNYKIELTPYFNDNDDIFQDTILYNDAVKRLTFADGTPFGIKEN